MAENKKSFILYCDLIYTIEKMPKEKAGELFLHILQYVNDKNPVTDDLIVNLTFEPIKQSLKRDLVKWEKFIEKQRENGLKGGRPKSQENPNNPTLILANPTEPKKADSVSVSVSDSVIVNDINKENKFSFKKKMVEYGFNENLVIQWIQVRKTKRATNTEIAYNKFIEEVSKRKCDINKILEFIISKSWQGFKWEWYDNENKNQQQHATSKEVVTQAYKPFKHE